MAKLLASFIVRACNSWKSVGMKGLGVGRCSAGSAAASHAASQSAGIFSQLY